MFYYVLSGGRHPFGDQYRRQANILAGEYDVEKIVNSECKELYLFDGFICQQRSSAFYFKYSLLKKWKKHDVERLD